MSVLPPLQLRPLPQINLRHLFVLTDGTGILQHATHSTPDLHHGYCTDDNARALIAAVKVRSLPRELRAPGGPIVSDPDQLVIVTQRYLAFLAYAFNAKAGRFRNFMQYDRTWLEEVGSEDSHARTIWALGEAVRRAPNEDIRDLVERLLRDALPAVERFEHLKPRAYALIGLDEYLRAAGDEQPATRFRREMAEHLFDVWRAHATNDWPWWEDWLTWGNAKLPHALLAAGAALNRQDMVDTALRALRWLLDVQTGEQGQLSIIGNDGWYFRGRHRARYAQQPIEAKGLVQVCLAAATVTGERQWADEACRCFEWFTGRNDTNRPLYNADTGGGQDGLEATGVNTNQGAESTLAYILAALELHAYDLAQKGDEEPAYAAPSAPTPPQGSH